MDEKKLLEKWLNHSLTETEKEEFQNSEDFPFYRQLIEDASRFKASQERRHPEGDR